MCIVLELIRERYLVFIIRGILSLTRKAKQHKKKSLTVGMFQATAAGAGASDNLNLERALDDHVSSHLVLLIET